MSKKYTVSEAALRKLVKQMVTEEIEKQWNHPDGPFIDEFSDDPWGAYFGEPEPDQGRKNAKGSKPERPQSLPEWSERFQEFDEFDAPPFLNRPKKK